MEQELTHDRIADDLVCYVGGSCGIPLYAQSVSDTWANAAAETAREMLKPTATRGVMTAQEEADLDYVIDMAAGWVYDALHNPNP